MRELFPYVAPVFRRYSPFDMETIRKVLRRLYILLFESSSSRGNRASVERFVAARRLFSRPVIVRHAVSPHEYGTPYILCIGTCLSAQDQYRIILSHSSPCAEVW
jgi:hypothetical protein